MNEKRNIICYGEMLWDCYPDTKKPGGAPLNVAAHLAMHGNQTSIITKVGKDKLGTELLAFAKAINVDCNYVQETKDLETGQVLVTLTDKGIPHYEILAPVAWDNIENEEQLNSAVANSAAFVYGSLAARNPISKKTLLNLLKLSNLNICDLNIRQSYFSRDLLHELLSRTHILKINEEEAVLLSKLFNLKYEKLMEKIADKFGLDMVILTLGSKGAEVLEQGIVYKTGTYKIVPVDTVGSGDAFLAAFIHSLLAGEKIESALDHAMLMGAYVATQQGAIPHHNLDMIAKLKKTA